MRRLPRTTTGLVALVSAVLAAVTVLLGLLIYGVSHEALELQLDGRVATETHALMLAHQRGGIAELAAEIGRREQSQGGAGGMGYLLVDKAGVRIAGKLAATAPEPGWREFLYTTGPGGARGVSQALTTLLPDGGKLVVGADRTPIDEIDLTILGLFLGAFGVMLVFGVGGAWALGLVIRRRLETINGTAQAIIAGDLQRRIPRDGTSSEFDQLADTLNTMLDRNAQLLENLQQVSSDIAHDMRTPLARLRNVLDAAQDEATDVEAAREALQRASDHAQDILDLFTALLRISEIETFQVRGGFQRVNLTEIVERCVDAFRLDLEASGHAVTLAPAPNIHIEGDRHLLSQLMVNLIENAARHTPRGSRIDIAVSRTEVGEVRLVVADDGPGVPERQRELVLRRFSRLEQSRGTPGYGLGLSLVSAIARAHYAEVVLGDNGPGLRVTLDFASPSAAEA